MPCDEFSFPAGEAQAVIAKAEAKAKAIRMLSDALTEQVFIRLLGTRKTQENSTLSCRKIHFIYIFMAINL